MPISGNQWSTVTAGTNQFYLNTMGGYLFGVTSFPGTNTLYRFNLQNPASYTSDTSFNPLGSGYSKFTNDGTYLYFTNYNTTGITRYNINGVLDTAWSNSPAPAASAPSATGITISGNYFYASSQTTTKIIQLNYSDASLVTSNWADLSSNVQGICSIGSYLYVCLPLANKVAKVQIGAGSPPSVGTIDINFISTPTPNEIVAYKNTIFVSNVANDTILQFDATTGSPGPLQLNNPSTSQRCTGLATAVVNYYTYLYNGDGYIYQYLLSYDPPPCFKEGTKILTDKGYVLIEDLRKGDLVKTLLHGFLPIDTIGKKDIEHPATSDRNKDQLYKCSQNFYPELLEDLVITGCHSILIDRFDSDKQKEKTFEILGDIFITDKKYRLPACVDERASVYETPGTYTIYHLALENEHYTGNYGIYANGLLVETCSKRYLKDLSNMELID